MDYGKAIFLNFWISLHVDTQVHVWMGGWETGRPDVGKAFNYKEVYF